MERTLLEDAVQGWLASGPLSVEELATRAVRGGLLSADVDDEGEGPEERIGWLLERSDAYWSSRFDSIDEAVVLTSTFTETGMTFTHRVTAAELESEALEEMPDLSVVLWDCRDGLPLDDGSGPVHVDYSDPTSSRLVGPPGWLEAVGAGELLAFTRRDGVLSVEIVEDDELEDGSAEMEALREAAETWIGDGRGCEELPVVMEALARDSQLFHSAVPPVEEMLTAVGLERRSFEWGWADEDWKTRQERSKDHDASVRRLYGFDACCDRAYDRVEEAWSEHAREGAVDGQALAEDLRHGAVAAAFVHAHADTPNYVVRFATALVETSTGRRAAPALTLQGLAHLRALDPEQAYGALDSAVRADPDFGAAAGGLALLELDKGNVARAHALALRDGVDADLIELLGHERARQATLRPSAGRNDPCPCGSGKKFKRCCAESAPLTLTQRVPLVLQRMAHHATGPEGHDTLFGLALSAAGDHDDVVGAIRRFLDEPFLVDVAVHEGGLGDDYLDQRRPLLAEDEVAMLEAVLEQPRRLWEITAVEPGASLTLRDTRSGDVLEVDERSGSEGREPGELMLSRATTVDGRAMLFGVPLIVPLRERARVLRMLDGWVDADVLAMWFGSLFLPPRIVNRDGEELDVVFDGPVDDDEIERLDLDDMPGEVRALMEQHIVEYEQRWVEESIPALAGLSPREALDDPTRREDLLALLREMRAIETSPGGVGMSVQRVERLLGIDES